jgi:hypothetical protein
MSIFSNIFKTTDSNSSKNLQEFSCFEDFFDHKYYPFSKATKRRSHLELYVFDKAHQADLWSQNPRRDYQPGS